MAKQTIKKQASTASYIGKFTNIYIPSPAKATKKREYDSQRYILNAF